MLASLRWNVSLPPFALDVRTLVPRPRSISPPRYRVHRHTSLHSPAPRSCSLRSHPSFSPRFIRVGTSRQPRIYSCRTRSPSEAVLLSTSTSFPAAVQHQSRARQTRFESQSFPAHQPSYSHLDNHQLPSQCPRSSSNHITSSSSFPERVP
jgi:hypothetical protein